MTRRRKLKRRIRDRMARTGESYSAARAVFVGRARSSVVEQPVIMIPVSEMSRAIAFYRDALGFPLISRNKDDGWAELGDEKTMLALHAGATTGVDTGLGMLVSDVTALARLIVAGGGRVVEEGEPVTTALDPDGNVLRLMRGTAP